MSSPRDSRYVDIRYTNASTYPSSSPISFSKSPNATVENQSRNCSTSTRPHKTASHSDHQKPMMNVSAPPNLLSSRKNRYSCGARRHNNSPSTMTPSKERTSRKSVAPPRTRLNRRPQPKQPSTRIRSQQHSDPRQDIRFTSSPQCKPYLI